MGSTIQTTARGFQMIIDIINELASTSSRLEKEAILNRENNNKLLQRVCMLALDPFTQFYQRKIPKYKPAAANVADSLDSVLSSLEVLSSRQVTGNAAIEFLQKLLSSTTEGDSKVIERIIEKDLRCGVSEKTVNKIWPGLVAEYPVMLCAQFDEKTENYVSFPATVQLKLDGMRFNAICKNNGTVEFRTRNGKQIDLRGHLEKQFSELAGGEQCVFDGELLVYDEDFYQYLPRQTSNGILSKSLKGTITEAECQRVGATLWDVIPLEDFQTGKSTVVYKNRFAKVSTKVAKLNHVSINTVWSKQVDTLDEAKQLFEQFLSEGQEGVILKNNNSPWESKRVKHQVKFKGELECDLKIVGWEEGTGKNAKRLGALVCESRDRVVRVSVGSGFTDSDRDAIKPDCVGSIVAVKYNSRIKDKKTDIDSLFLPTFIEIRQDKDVADSSNMIK